MAQVRLTIAIKDKLTSSLVEHAFTQRSRDHMAAELAFAQDVYDDVMTREVRIGKRDVPLAKAVKMLPSSWVTHDDDFYVTFAGDKTRLDRYEGLQSGYRENAGFVGLLKVDNKDRKDWLFPPKWGNNSTCKQYDARSPLSERYAKLKGAREDLIKEISSEGGFYSERAQKRLDDLK